MLCLYSEGNLKLAGGRWVVHELLAGIGFTYVQDIPTKRHRIFPVMMLTSRGVDMTKAGAT